MTQKKNSIEFIPMTCPSCNGDLMISPKLDKAICSYCGHSFFMIKNSNANQAIAQNLITLGDDSIKSYNNEEAYNYYTKALEIEPENYRAWFGKARTSFWHQRPSIPLAPSDTFGFGSNEFQIIDEVKSYFDNAFQNSPEIEKAAIKEYSSVEILCIIGNCADIWMERFKGYYPANETDLGLFQSAYLGTVITAVELFDEQLNEIPAKNLKLFRQLYIAVNNMESLCTQAHISLSKALMPEDYRKQIGLHRPKYKELSKTIINE